MPKFQPLVPARLTDPQRLRFPLYLSPKVDGVRASLHSGLGPVTRNGNLIQNPHVRLMLADPRLHGLDGEIAVGAPNVPEVVTRTITAVILGRQPVDFSFMVFDDFMDQAQPFSGRTQRAHDRVAALALPWLHILPQWLVEDAAAMWRIYEGFLAHGFEGGVLRAPQGRYRQGRAAEASRLAIKIKPPEMVARQREAVQAQLERKAALRRVH